MLIGDKARRTRTVTARDIELFSQLTGDRNPLHYDLAAASASRFGGIIVQGGVVLEGTAVVYREPRMHAHPLHQPTAQAVDL
jgi:acyl dehydratase